MTSSNLQGVLTGVIQDDLSVRNEPAILGTDYVQDTINGIADFPSIPDGNISVEGAVYDATYREYILEGIYGTFYFVLSAETSTTTIGTWQYFLDRNEDTKALSVNESVSEEFSLTYTTTSGVEYTDVVSITINGADDPFFFNPENAYSFSIDENSAVDTPIGTVRVTDVDSTPLAPTYSITAISFVDRNGTTQNFMGDDLEDAANNPFAINANTGEIQVKKLRNYEVDPTSYTLTVQATDNSDDPDASDANTVTTEVTIQVNNVLEFIFAPGANSYTENISEGIEVPISKAETGIMVGQVSTESVIITRNGRSAEVSTNYAIVEGDTNLFRIDRISGEIYLKNPDAAIDSTDTQPLLYVPASDPNFDPDSSNMYELTIEANAGSLASRTTVTFEVTDVDNTAPVPVPSADIATIAENDDGGDSDLTFTMIDPDTLQSKFIPDYWTINEVDDAGNATETGRFEIVRMDNTDTWKLKLITGKSLDAEGESTINLQILLTDGTNESTTPVEIQVNVDDADEFAPELNISNSNIGTIEENDAGANSGIVFTVTDEDRTKNPIDSSGFSISGDQYDKFEVITNDNGATWALKLKNGQELNREEAGTLNLSVTVNDGHKTSEAKNIVINVTDVDEFAPEVRFVNGATDTIVENALSVNSDITFTVTDEDSTKHPIDSDDFQITGEQSNKFEIVDDNGVWRLKLKANQSLNHEEDSTLNLQILVDDGSRESEAKNITINVTDVNDNAPLLIAYPSTANITENAVASDSGVAFFIVDADTDTVNSFEADHFAITGEQSSKFEVVDDNGTWRLKLKANQSLDHEEDDEINLQITVHDGSSSNVSNVANVVVNVDNVDEGKATYGLNATSPAVGGVVTVTRSNDDPDGNGDGAASYRWSRINPIKGTFTTIDVTDVNSYTLTGDDIGHMISVTVIYTDGAERATQVSTNAITVGGVNTPPVLSFTGTADILNVVGGSDGADNIDTGIVFTISDANNTPATFKTESFTITGEQSNKFEVADDNGVWRLKLKSGQTLDSSSGNSVALQVTVSDGLDISNTVTTNVAFTDVTEYSFSVNENTYGPNNTSLVGALVAPLFSGNNVVASIEMVNGLGSNSVFTLEQVGFTNLFYLELQDVVRLYNHGDASYRVLVKFEKNVGLSNHLVEHHLVHVNVLDTVSIGINGTDSAETIRGDFGDNTIRADDGNDIIYGGHGHDVIRGQRNDDTIYGEEGNDKLYGGYGNDTLSGGDGIDILSGRAGNDIYVLDLRDIENNIDIVLDFDRREIEFLGEDSIRVDTATGSETSFGELGIYVSTENKIIPGVESGQNISRTDSVIYKIKGERDDALNRPDRDADDLILMVVEDFTGLNIDMFDIM